MSEKIWEKVETVARSRKIPDETIKTWKHRKKVPGLRRDELVEAARKLSIPLTYEELKSISLQ